MTAAEDGPVGEVPPEVLTHAAIGRAADSIRGTGSAVEIGGVRIEECDTYGATATTRRADAAEARLRAEVERLRAQEITDAEYISRLRAALLVASGYGEADAEGYYPGTQGYRARMAEARAQAAEARLRAVEALADEWDRRDEVDPYDSIMFDGCAAALRAALSSDVAPQAAGVTREQVSALARTGGISSTEVRDWLRTAGIPVADAPATLACPVCSHSTTQHAETDGRCFTCDVICAPAAPEGER